MTTTDEVVAFARTTTPPEAVLERAAAELDRFRRAADTYGEHAVVRALRQAVPNPESPVWTACLRGVAAVFDEAAPEWVAVCAAASALKGTDSASAGDAEVVEATAVGYEVAERVADALGKSHTAAGWCVRATAGAIGAVVAAGRVLGLDTERFRDAVGICATQAAGLNQADGTEVGAVQIGKAASNAVEAVLLAHKGFTSSAQPLEGRRGMFALLSAEADVAAVTEKLGVEWR